MSASPSHRTCNKYPPAARINPTNKRFIQEKIGSSLKQRQSTLLSTSIFSSSLSTMRGEIFQPDLYTLDPIEKEKGKRNYFSIHHTEPSLSFSAHESSLIQIVVFESSCPLPPFQLSTKPSHAFQPPLAPKPSSPSPRILPPPCHTTQTPPLDTHLQSSPQTPPPSIVVR